MRADEKLWQRLNTLLPPETVAALKQEHTAWVAEDRLFNEAKRRLAIVARLERTMFLSPFQQRRPRLAKQWLADHHVG